MSLPLTLGNTLTLYYVNATSLAKTHAVQHLHSEIFANRVHVALIAESWFSVRHLDADAAIDGYLLFRRDRFQRKGGGVCAYVDARLSCKLFRPCVNHNLVEILWLKVCSETELYFIACAYHPPKPMFRPCVNHNLVEILWLKVCSETELYFIACAYHLPKPKYDSKVFRMS